MKETRARTVGELAEVVKGRVYGDPQTVIRGIASIQEARSGDITYAESRRFLADARHSSASAILSPDSPADLPEEGGGVATKVTIQVANPRLAFAQLLDLFAPEQYSPRGIHASAVIGSDFRAGANVSVGAHCVLGENVRLGENVTIYPLAYIGDDVEIGDNTIIEPNVTLLRGTVIGQDSTIHSGTVVGADGFGYLNVGGKHRKVPQIGHVVVGDEVEIGSNVTIDRARTGATRIGSGTKIDNLVHIGHNCQIGENCIIVAQVGLAGGVELGKGAILGGQTGVKEQVHIGAGAILGAQTGVMGDVPAGAFVSGYGAKPHKEVLRTAAAVNNLPNLMKKMREMERRLQQLEQSGASDTAAEGDAAS